MQRGQARHHAAGGTPQLHSRATVMTTPLSADDALSHLRVQVDELARELEGSDDAIERGAMLKQRIFVAHRIVEQHVQQLELLQRDVRLLVAGWKERFTGSGSSFTPPGARAVTDTDDPDAGSPGTPAHTGASEFAVDAASQTDAEATHKAAAHTATALSVSGQPRVIDELNASTFVERGWSRIATGDFGGAEEALDKALQLNPGDPHAETLLGWAQRAQGKLDAAMSLFQQVLDRVPDHALALINVGYVLFRRQQFERSVEHLSRAIALDTDRKATLYAHYYLGLVRYAQEEYAEAIGELLRAIELGPNLIEARFELGRVFWYAERTDDAIATWRKGAELNKFNPWSARCREMLDQIADGGAPARVN